MTSHVDPETLALFAEGLLDEDEEKAVRAYLAESEEARERLSALTEVQQLLAAAPAPPIPDGLITRLDEALREEARKHTASAGDGTVPRSSSRSPVHMTPFRPKRGPIRWMPYLVAAAAVVFVLGAGAAVLNGLFAPAPQNSAAETPHQAREPEAALPHRGLSVASSGTEYTAADLSQQGASTLNRFAFQGGPPAPGDDAGSASLLSEQDVPSEVSSCVSALNSAHEAPRGQPALIDIASYEGEPAWIMFFPITGEDASEGHELRVIAPACGAGADPATAIIATAVIPTG